jgi:hypothetical protein
MINVLMPSVYRVVIDRLLPRDRQVLNSNQRCRRRKSKTVMARVIVPCCGDRCVAICRFRERRCENLGYSAPGSPEIR